jgi:hypothetical protein
MALLLKPGLELAADGIIPAAVADKDCAHSRFFGNRRTRASSKQKRCHHPNDYDAPAGRKGETFSRLVGAAKSSEKMRQTGQSVNFPAWQQYDFFSLLCTCRASKVLT